MPSDSKFLKDEEGNTAVRVVEQTEQLPAADKDWMFARDVNGNIAVRVVSSVGENSPLRGVVERTIEIPTATANNYGKVYLYQGTTDSTYTHGYLYENQATTIYDLTIGFTPGKIAFDYTKGVLADFFEPMSDDYYKVVKGSFKYLEAGDLWEITGLDEEDNVIINAYKLYSLDLEDAGFVFINPKQDYSDGEILEFDLIAAPSNVYSWVRLDVMPITGATLGAGYDATKTQTLKNVSGVLIWVDD